VEAEKKGKRVLITIEPFATASRHSRVDAEAEAERLGRSSAASSI